MRYVLLILLFAAFGYALALVLLNNHATDIHLVFTQILGINTGLVLILSLILGIVIGLLLGVQVFKVFQTRWENGRLKKQLKEAEQKNEQLNAEISSLQLPRPAAGAPQSQDPFKD